MSYPKELIAWAERRAALLRDLPSITLVMFERTQMVIHREPDEIAQSHVNALSSR